LEFTCFGGLGLESVERHFKGVVTKLHANGKLKIGQARFRREAVGPFTETARAGYGRKTSFTKSPEECVAVAK